MSVSPGYSLLKDADTPKGVGSDYQKLTEQTKNLRQHFREPISREKVDPRQRFAMLAARWYKETAPLSSVSEIAMHPAYQEIIGMGQEALPLILCELQQRPGHWFWALRAITGEDPVRPEQRGKIREMTAAWLLWGKEHGYVA